MTIYRLRPDYKGSSCFFSWHQKPDGCTAPDFLREHKLSLDPMSPRPLVTQDRAFLASHVACAHMPASGIGDAIGQFDLGEMIVSARVADIVKAVDPDMQDLVHLPAVWSAPDGVRLPSCWYFLNVYRSLPTVALEQSKVGYGMRGAGDVPFSILTSPSDAGCVVYPVGDKGLHLWRDTATHALFVSEVMAEALMELDLVGVRLSPCTPLAQ